jgi:hypothetical protein
LQIVEQVMPMLVELKAKYRREVEGVSLALPPAKDAAEEMITLSLPADTSLGVPVGRWERRGDRVVATYTREELRLVVGLALERKRVALEVRMARGLEVLRAATGCADAEAERLLAHWDTLNAEYDRIMAGIKAIDLDYRKAEGVG